MKTAPETTLASNGDLDYRPSYLAATIAGAAVFLLYLITLAPSTAMWDTSEYIASAYVLGLPHPPGNPFFVLIGKVFTLLPIAPNIAMRVNILAAVCSAVSAGMWFLITERVLVGWFPKRWQRITAGSIAALVGATASTVWAQSVVNEKVYTVSLVGLAIVSWLTVRWCDDPDGPKADRLLVLVAYLSGLGYANHMAGFLALPTVAIAVLIRKPGTVLRWKLLLAIGAALVFGMTPFATQPIRAAHFPEISEGEPTACKYKIAVDCTFDKVTWDRFKYNFDRGQYGKPELTDRQAPFTAQVGMWWLYFKWQWIRDVHNDHQTAQNIFAAIFLILGLAGGYVHWKRDPRSFSFFGPLIFSVTLLLIYYMNFKYGASQSPELGETVAREVRDRDYFYLWSFSTWSVWVALGLAYLWETFAAALGSEKVKVGKETIDMPKGNNWLYALPVFAIALVPLFANWDAASRRGQTDTADFAADMLNSVEPYGILVTVGDNDTFPLWYAQEVEGIRQDVIVANTSLLRTEWYTRQLIRNPVREYDAAKGPAIYRNRVWKKPSGPPVKLTLDEADSVPIVVPLTQPQMFVKPGTDISVMIPPRDLMREDMFVLYMIRDIFPDRPIFFSRTAGNYGEELGFGKYLLGVGLAQKLMPTPVPMNAPRDSIIGIPGEGLYDLATTTKLWEQTFKAPTSLAKRTHWMDRPSAGIPYLYVRTGMILSDALGQLGRKAEAEKIGNQVVKIAEATQMDEVVKRARR